MYVYMCVYMSTSVYMYVYMQYNVVLGPWYAFGEAIVHSSNTYIVEYTCYTCCIREIWEQSPLLLRRHKPHYNDGWFSTSELDRILREVRTLHAPGNIHLGYVHLKYNQYVVLCA